jgi:F-type H+-transporting ATPase subunit a
VLVTTLAIICNTEKTALITQPVFGNLLSGQAANLLITVQRNFLNLNSAVLKSNTILYKSEYFSLLSFLFLVIFLCNIFGLFPYTYTLTSSFVVTFFLAATQYLAVNIIATYKHNWKFLNLFLPSGVPIFIAPFLVLVEFVSYLAKVLSLSIRLFANMMSGHALLKILIGFA